VNVSALRSARHVPKPAVGARGTLLQRRPRPCARINSFSIKALELHGHFTRECNDLGICRAGHVALRLGCAREGQRDGFWRARSG
ncbi:hypothetical protein RZS08_14435, partial [Arthrospira platensis SPKY1]|nr:hypothetical protein [Arthrospira platensis SPKY1]